MSKTKRQSRPKKVQRRQPTDRDLAARAARMTAMVFIDTAMTLLKEDYGWSDDQAAEFGATLITRAGEAGQTLRREVEAEQQAIEDLAARLAAVEEQP